MKKRGNPTVYNAGYEPANPQAIVDKSGQRKDGSAGGPVANATQHGNKTATPTEQDLLRSLNELRAMPRKFSRSYLVPFTELLLELTRKGSSFRGMLKVLREEHGVQPSLSTLSNFLRKAKREERRLRKSPGTASPIPLGPSASPSENAESLPADVSPPPEQTTAVEMRAAIRAAKERANSAKQQSEKPLFSFDEHKPLSINPQPKPN